MYGDHISKSITAFAIACVVVGGLIGAFVGWVLPWLWGLVKPWLHMVAA